MVVDNTVDFHGVSLVDAEYRLHQVVGRVRVSGSSAEYRFVTGYGPIKQMVQNLLGRYGLYCDEELGNGGVLRVLIE